MQNEDANERILDLLRDPKTRLEVYRAVADAKFDPNTGNRKADVVTKSGDTVSIEVIAPMKPRARKLSVG